MEWRDKACFEAHIATPHVKHAEDRLKREKMLIEPAKQWHFYRLSSSVTASSDTEALVPVMLSEAKHPATSNDQHFPAKRESAACLQSFQN
jgi:hypothetical protein